MGARVAEADFTVARDVFRRTWESHPGNDLEAIESAIRASLEAYEARRLISQAKTDADWEIYVEKK